MNPLRTAPFALATLLATAAAPAQDLDGQVVRDPNAGLATYTFQFDGPPRGCAYLFVSPWLLPSPFQVGGIHNPLFINPILGLPPFGAALDAAGQGGLQFVLPMSVADGLVMQSQALMIEATPAAQLAFTPFIANVIATPPGMSLAADYVRGNINVRFAQGPAGGNVTVWVNGGQKATGRFILGANGQGGTSVPVPGGLESGDRVTILVDGQPVREWTH